jgi:predicted Zn-dependent protease
MDVETMYGERAHLQETSLLEPDSKIGKKYYPIANKMLAEIEAKIGQPYDYHFKLFIQKSAGHNASSRPGGYLYVEKGLLDSPDRYPKAYFAIAHEIAHVLQRHETFELQSMIVDSLTVGEDMEKTIASAGVNPDAVLSRAKYGKHVFIRHHIDQELQADSCATRLLSRVFPDRAGLEHSLTAFLKDLPKPEPVAAPPVPTSDADRLAASVHEVVDTPIKVHPNSAEREANLRAMYAAVAAAPVAGRE